MRNNRPNNDYTFDMRRNVLFKKDEHNYIYVVGAEQLPTIGNMSLMDIYLMEGNAVEFHYHPNASEVIYCVTGEVEAGFMHADDNKWQQFKLKPGEVLSLPQGYWHYVGATEDNTHILATFDTDNLQTVFGSDILRITPKELMADMYCLDKEELEKALDPLDETVFIGPPKDCNKNKYDKHNAKRHMQMNDRHSHDRHKMEKPQRRIPEVQNSVHEMMERGPGREMKEMQRDLPPVRYGGTVVREMNVCESCMQKLSR